MWHRHSCLCSWEARASFSKSRGFKKHRQECLCHTTYEKCGTPSATVSSKSSFSVVQPVSVASVFVSTND